MQQQIWRLDCTTWRHNNLPVSLNFLGILHSSISQKTIIMEPSDSKEFIWKKNGKSVRRRTDMSKLNVCVEQDGSDVGWSCDTNSISSCSSNDSLCTETKSEADNLRNSRIATTNRNFNKSKTLSPVGLDCEMVGVGDEKSSALARCSVVSHEGDVLYDVYVKPDKPITDYRTQWSGIRPKHMNNAISFRSARKKVKRMIKKRILVGHALQFDLKVLKLIHPSDLIRDTSKHIPLRALAGFPRNSTPSLKRLTRQLLKWDIQVNEHSSVEDARAAMFLYRKCESQWEKDRKGKGGQSYLEDAYWPNWTEL